jgi:hypothetical protein
VPRSLHVLSIAIGLVLLVGAPLVWGVSRGPISIGEVPAVARPANTEGVSVSASADDADSVDAPAASATKTAGAASPAVPLPAPPHDLDVRVPMAPSRDPSPAVTDPVRIRIDAIDIDVPVIPVGLEDDGGMEIPDDVHEIGWYEPGVRPGEQGSAVLAGHVDSKEQGKGSFYGLRELELGDLVTVTTEDGTEQRWEVVAREQYPKDVLPIDELFVWGGETERLALITCGGSWNRSRSSYSDNIVVYTQPA